MDKVMRPRYDARFEEFRRYNQSQLFVALEKTMDRLGKLKKSGELMTPEDFAAMEGLVSLWTLVRENETKKDAILRRRKYLFIYWMISVGLSTAAIEYSTSLIAAPNITIGQAATDIFFLLLAYSVYYGWQIYDLDDKLSKFSGTISKPSEFQGLKEGEGLVLENRVSDELTRNKIAFSRRTLVRAREGLFEFDFVIPSVDNAQFLVEVRSSLSIPAGYELARLARQSKSIFPATKMILITDAKPTKEMLNFLLSRDWYQVFEISDLDQLISLVKRELV